MKIKNKSIGVIGVRGLPPRHGAFDQHIHNLIKYSSEINDEKLFYVLCDETFKKYNYEYNNCIRIFIKRGNGIFIIFSNIIGIIKFLFFGIKNFIFFGYSMSFIFKFLKLFNCSIICNVDGIEWKRSQSFFKKKYYKFCEKLVSKSKAKLIFDSIAIKRYYSINHKVNGSVIYYASDFENLTRKTINKKFIKCFVPMRFVKENNIEIIINAIKKFNHIKLYLSGNKNDYFKNTLSELIKNSKNIFYLGPVYCRKKLENYWNSADFYIHGHSVGGTNPTLIEAISLSKPIISYNAIFNRLILNENYVFFNSEKELIKILEEKKFLNVKPIKLNSNFKIDKIHYQTFELF